MAKNLKSGERISVDKPLDFDPSSETYVKGLEHVEAGRTGVVVSAAPQGRASIVDFDGIYATVSNQRLNRLEAPPAGKKRGRKKRQASALAPVKTERAPKTASLPADDTSLQLINHIANTLLLNGGLKADSEVVIQLQFAELSEAVKAQIRALIEAKLALNKPALS